MADERDPDSKRLLRDQEVSKQYRELEPIEPSPELDRKILDAARAAASPHAPLVAPAGRHRWYYGLAAAAVLVFAVALTLHMERERPDPEAAAPLRLEHELRGQIKPAAPPEAPPESKPEQKLEASPPVTFAPEPPRAAASRPARGDALRLSRDRPAAEGAAADTAAQSQIQSEARARREAAGAERLAPAPAAAQVAAAPEKPEPWLERIAELRSRGRHTEADRELAAFRKAYPDYRLSDLMRERVEGTPAPSQ